MLPKQCISLCGAPAAGASVYCIQCEPQTSGGTCLAPLTKVRSRRRSTLSCYVPTPAPMTISSPVTSIGRSLVLRRIRL